MGKQRSGSVFKRVKGKKITWWARLTFIDAATGKRKDLQRRAENKAHAEELREQLVKEYDTGGSRLLDAERMTFAELAQHCKDNYFQVAQYDSEGRKIVGIRDVVNTLAVVNTLIDHFGRTRLRDITAAHLTAYRAARLKTTTRHGTTRSIATVNREMSKMRMMLNVAVANDWIVKSPFARAKAGSLISIADERQRERILSPAEERRLLTACDTPKRAHLHALVVAALDTGARQGELLNLKWEDVDLENRTFRVTSYKGKTVHRRELYITTRLYVQLEKLRAANDGSAYVFQSADNAAKRQGDAPMDNVKWSFTKARTEAGLDGLRFHDLRHTAATRLAAVMQVSEVGRVLGHSNPTTTYRYVNRTPEMVKRAGMVLEAFNTEAIEQEVQSTVEMVN